LAKFDSDFAIFGTFAADITADISIGEAVINYANEAGVELFGDFRGNTILEVIAEVSNTHAEAWELLQELSASGELSYEGTLGGKFVKYHSRVIDCRDDKSCGVDKFVQIGITDISEIVALKSQLYDTSEALKRAAKAADEDTGMHVARINQYSGLLAQLNQCEDKFIADIAQFAQLHDIGKIKVAETIRLPRKLTPDEIISMKKHTIYGGEMVAGLTGLEMAHNIALEHHERWDGSGYPSGKKQGDISLEARIVAIADVFDALVSSRPYKEAFSYDKTFDIMSVGDGRVMPGHFDPELLELFLEHYDQFVDLHKALKN